MADSTLELQHWIRLIEGGTPKGELGQLSEAVTVSERLSAIADELIGHFVEAARQAGNSWAQIGQRLGVTRQAAQQQFVYRERFDHWTDRALKVLQTAEDEARQWRHAYLGTEHILLGLLTDRHSLASKVLKELKVTPQEIREEIATRIKPGDSDIDGDLPLTPRGRKALDRSYRKALEMGHDAVATEHVLMGLLEEKGGVAAQVLSHLGIRDSKIRSKTLELLASR